MRRIAFGCGIVALSLLAGCGVDYERVVTKNVEARVEVRQRIAALKPAAGFAHRGQGITGPGNPFPENSLAAFREALSQGIDALEMDSELTRDGKLVLMHDDTVDRTTDCRGCVSELTFEEVRRCHLLDGDGNPTDQVPPTLEEVFALDPNILVNVELKIFSGNCLTPGHGPVETANEMVSVLRRLGVERRTIVQSFDADALARMKELAPDIYTAYLVSGLRQRDIDRAVELAADALQPGGPFPFLTLSPVLIRTALDAGLHVIVWTVDDVESMNTLLDDGVTGIITNDPALFLQVAAQRK